MALMPACMRLAVPLALPLPVRTASRLLPASPWPSCHLHVRLFHSRDGVLAVAYSPNGHRQPVRRLFSVSVNRQTASEDTGAQRPPKPAPRDRLPILRFLLRSILTPFCGQTIRGLYRKNPEETILAVAILVAFVFIFGYIARIYYTYFNSRQFTRYPPPVAKYLRRALYFSNYHPDPARALKNYKLALEQCDELRLDPLSDDVLGIRIQLASWLEKVENYEAAIKILELLLGDCKRWVDMMEKGVSDGSIQDQGGLSTRLPLRAKTPEGGAAGGEPLSEAETLWGRRSRLLRKAIGISVKLGELYADEHVLNMELAHERLVWSVDSALKEFQRRSEQGVKPDEGEWMSPREMGAALESLGLSYESQSQFHLALPLFFQALRFCKDPCHSAVIMNNLAVSFAQHPLQPPYETLVGPLLERKPGDAPPAPEEARKAYLEAAQRWAENARHHAAGAAQEVRTTECDTACVVALCTLGDIALLQDDPLTARRRFEQARDMGSNIAFAVGIEQAEAGLRKL